MASDNDDSVFGIMRLGNSTLVAASVMKLESFCCSHDNIKLEKKIMNLLDFETCCLFFRDFAPALRAATLFVVVVVVLSTSVLALLAGSCVSLGAFLFFDCPFSCFGSIPTLSFQC